VNPTTNSPEVPDEVTELVPFNHLMFELGIVNVVPPTVICNFEGIPVGLDGEDITNV
jgi:hypothetical protein